ncbi:hypothetical protein PR202_ga06338 [Eleusine coracana subsp. coracana]|uniref:Alkaline/neutral invertase n=1 Tax=Eleusine coracana subsp. coracana TaxID=191504 RepID=A0AAV5BUK3_ELECO|nr:hypothetical protein QOZ80_2AG0100250 [Eleusine coracana subsp. coracana]GJM90091.1 hypothetical protein PR202_ga06338 [Eleusine coracana subsp. coracana]
MVLCSEPPRHIKLPESRDAELTDDDNHDSSKFEKRTRMHHIERHRSCVMTLSDIEHNDVPSKSPVGGSQCSPHHEETPTDTNASHRHAIADAAWEALKRSVVYFRGQPIGTVAAIDKSQGAALNYDQVFMRDFIPSALAFLMKGEHSIVKNFLVETARLQSREKMVDLFKLGQGVMPASFKVHHRNTTQKTESLLADFGETAIGRVAPVDSGLWWIILLRAYTKSTGDNALAESPNCQRAMRLVLRLCLSEGCDTSPALLCADGCSMIDRRMGIYGYPIEIQALFFMALRCSLSLLKQDSDDDFVNHITRRIQALSYHLHSYYWLDFQRLNDIYRYKTEEYSQTALNKFNVIPESIPDWIFDFMPSRGGYFIGNVSPARMDFRWFCLGNFIAILSSLATGEQAEAILDLVEERWPELIGEMPLKICYPAMENQEWQIVTGCDPKNTRWSYHNAGSWPVLLWLLVAVSVKLGRRHLARKAMELMERRLVKDDFPEYYDGKAGRYIGKQARKFQTWSIAGYLVAKMFLDDPSHLRIIVLEDDGHSRSGMPFLKRSNSCP